MRIDPLFSPPDPPARVAGTPGDLRAGRPHGLAHRPARPDPGRQGRLRLGPARRRPVEEIRPGDVVWIPPGEKHWHGATATTAMTHIAIRETLNGSPVDRLEQVSHEDHRG